MTRPPLLPYLLIALSAMVMAKLSPEQLHVDVVTTGDCSESAGDDAFVTIHFRSFFDDGTAISSTRVSFLHNHLHVLTFSSLDPGMSGEFRSRSSWERRCCHPDWTRD